MAEKKFAVFAYGNKAEGFYYYIIDSLDKNDGSAADRFYLSRFDKPLFKQQWAGCIFPVEVENKSYSRNSNSTHVAIWESSSDRAAWRSIQAAYDEEHKLIEKGKENMLIKTLQPISEIYRAGNFSQRRLILAEVIRIITGGSK